MSFKRLQDLYLHSWYQSLLWSLMLLLTTSLGECKWDTKGQPIWFPLVHKKYLHWAVICYHWLFQVPPRFLQEEWCYMYSILLLAASNILYVPLCARENSYLGSPWVRNDCVTCINIIKRIIKLLKSLLTWSRSNIFWLHLSKGLLFVKNCLPLIKRGGRSKVKWHCREPVSCRLTT